MQYFRPIPMTDPARPGGALPLAGGWCWFDRVEVLDRGGRAQLIAAAELPEAARRALTAPRRAPAGLDLGRPRLMGILNVTPDSFSDGGRYAGTTAALAHAQAMVDGGADLIDIGGESTRPGAAEVTVAEEVARTAPVIAALRAAGIALPISIDTRKAGVAGAALAVGAGIVNDVSGLAHDPALGPLVAQADVPVCLMHMRGTPDTMNERTGYVDVLLDVYDELADRIDAALAAGIARERLIVDPGIGFAKTAAQNLVLIRGLSLFHGLGLPILFGASRKRFVGTIGGASAPGARMPGSVAVALAAAAQGAQILRVHDVAETRQALRLWQALAGMPAGDGE